ncbi:MAG: MMPL family transporter, partial [Deltaproteobacteria bacterium]|nr:MMPL family transporter [Nannocystaceae bacterium]
MPDAAPPTPGEPADARVRPSAVVRARWPILLVFIALCAWLVPGVRELQHDDDVLAFLPPEHPDVIAFREVADRFGMLEVALVGLRAPDGADLLTPERSEQVRTLARTLAELPGTRLVLDYPSLPDLKVDGDTLAVDPLVPRGETDALVLRARVLGNRDAVGNLISADGTSAALLVYLLPPAAGEPASARLDGIRAAVAEHWDGEAYFGGAPFIETNAASASRADIERLSPVVIAVLTITSAILLRSFTAALMNLVVAGLGVALVVGAHGRFGEPFTIVSSTTPVLMVALGGAFGMHLISGYQRRSGSSSARASGALRELWLAVVLSAATTAVAFFALLVMPQLPMQRFGVVAGLGVLVLLAIALLVVPGLLSLLPPRLIATRPATAVPFSLRPPAWVLAVLCGVGLLFGARLEADPDTRNVFDEDSEPARADRFFNEQFGGSQYIQIAILADMRDPVVLREIRQLADRLRGVAGVVDVRSLVDPVEMLTEGFGGRRGLPRDQGQARRVLGNLADHPAMAQLLTNDLEGAIVHVKIAPLGADALAETTTAVRAITDALPVGPLRVGAHV